MNTLWDRGSKLKDRSIAGEAADWIRTRIDSFNRRGRSRANVAHHYDIGNDLYRLLLDSDLQYSCAYWPSEEMTREEAQAAKKDHIAAKVAPAPGDRKRDV